MEWLPGNADFLTVFGAVLAAATAGLGLAVGLSQFSGPAKARRIIEWTSAALDSEHDSSRRSVLEQLKVHAQGHLIAARYIPGWRFTEAIVWAFLAPVFLILTAQKGDGTTTVTMVLVSIVTLALVFRRAIRLYTERQRVIHQFALGGTDVEPVHIDILHQMEGGTRREFTLGFACAVSVTATGGLLAWGLIEGRGSAAWIWAGLGAFACWNCVQIVHGYAKRTAQRQRTQVQNA